MKETFRFKVNLSGMIDILGNHLYSSQDVFIRELLQNAIDAISARKEAEPNWSEGKIVVSLIHSGQEKTIVFEDNGIGLTEEEIHRFLAIIGESSKRGSIHEDATHDYIGRFGIGLLSCFMVSDEIDVITRSLKDPRSYHWKGLKDGTYVIQPLESQLEPGTRIYLKCRAGKENYFTGEKLMELLKHYGILLPIPIYFSEGGVEKRLNLAVAPWDDPYLPPEEILAFGEAMFNQAFYDYIPLHSETGGVKGFGYILPQKAMPQNKNKHRIYLKNMLLTETGENILPDWAFFVKCIFNTNFLNPTASREGFYRDEVLEKTKEELGQCIIRYLSRLSKVNPDRLKAIIRIHSLAMKALAVEDDEVYRDFIDYLPFPTTQGELTGYDLRSKYPKLIYTYSIDKFRQMSSIFIAQNKLLVNGGYIYDRELIEKMPQCYPEVAIEGITGMDLENILEEASFEEQERAYTLIKTANIVLNPFHCNAEIKAFAPSELPVLYHLDEKAATYRNLLRDQETIKNSFAGMLGGFAAELEAYAYGKLYFNLRNPLVQKLIELQDPTPLRNCIKLLYVQALMIGHYPLRNNEMNVLNQGILSLVEWGLNQ